MRSLLFLPLFLVLCTASVLAQTWNGSVSQVWTNPLNWTPNVVPTSGSSVVINPAPNIPKLPANTSLTALSTSSGASLDFNGFTLSVGNAGAFNTLSGTTFLNTNGATDIVLNITTPSGGFNFQINGCTFSDHVTINVSGGDAFLEAQTSANTYNGNVTYNINSGLTTNFSISAPSQFNGNLQVNRTVAGTTNLFTTGGLVTGNFNYQNTAGGNTGFGTSATNTTINGTCTINAIYAAPANFAMTRIKNLTTGGTVNVQNCVAPQIQTDSLKITSFTIQGYEGNEFARFFNNRIEGNVTLEDDLVYGGGYYTEFRNNFITGNTSFTLKGSNHVYESNAANTGSVYTGNTTFNLAGSGNLYFSNVDTSIFNGNLTLNRTVGGYTQAFGSGAVINGNFTYNNTSSGQNDLGNVNRRVIISGTVNMNVNLTAVNRFTIHRLINQTGGGKINVFNSSGFDIQSDSLVVDSLNVRWYRGNDYGYFINNQIQGHVTLADSTSFGGGYNTQIRNSTITGNTNFKIYGTNAFYEAHTSANNYNGNLLLEIFGSSAVYTSYAGKSTITGNYTVNRTGAGGTSLFINAATIGGNFSCTKLVDGAIGMGTTTSKTTIGGTININIAQSLNASFALYRIQNSTNGGSIIVNTTQAPDIQQDTLLVSNFQINGYGGGAYCSFINNQITGNVTLSDVASYTGGYDTRIRNSTITGNTIFNCNGTNHFYEAYTAANTFNGNLTINVAGSGNLFTSYSAKSTINGNFTVNRTGAGYTALCSNAAAISGNFSYTKHVIGATDIGNIGNKTSIGGTIHINVTQDLSNGFTLHRVQNVTNGGSISLSSIRGFSIQQDTLLVSTFSINNYGGSDYGYLYNNQISGNVTVTTDPSFGGGYATYIRNNTLTGNTIFNVNGSNHFYEAYTLANTYNGNLTFNVAGSGNLYTSYNASSTITGNYTVNRTAAGLLDLLGTGVTIGGNFSLTKNTGGSTLIGITTIRSAIAGTININVTQNPGDDFRMLRVRNLTPGGSVTVNTCKAPTIQQDSLVVNSFSIHNYHTGAYAYFYDNQIQGDFSTNPDPSYGGGYASYFRSNTITGNTTISNPSGGTFNDADAGASGNTFLGNVTYSRTGAAALNVGTGDTNFYAGNVVFNNTAALPITAEFMRFIGSANTSIDQSGTGPIVIQKPIMAKTSGGRVTLNKPVTASVSCTFVSGYINSTSSNPLIFPDNINHTGASDNSHVVGCVTKAGNDVFSFPVGNGIGYHPIRITAPTNTTDSFQACIILKHPSDDGYDVNLKDAALLQIAPYHYWTLNQISGANSEAISLGWSIPCANTVVASLPGMAVARWDGSQWSNLGNSGTTGTTSLGTVTQTGTTSNFGVFGLSTTSALNNWQITTVSASASTVCQGVSTTLTGAGAATYNWMPGNLTGTSVVVTPLVTTTYTVTGTSATGCITTATRTIIVNPLPTTSTTISANPICQGFSTTITASGANAGYVWQPGGATSAAITVSPASTTTYTVTGTNNFGCTLSATRLVTVNPLPSVGTTVTNATICLGQSTSITGTGAVSYSWQPGSLSGTTINVSPASTTTYTITGTGANGCTNTATRTITVNTLPTVGTTVTNATICQGQSTSITGTGAVSYSWQPGSLSGTTINVSPASTTTYTVTGTGANGCTNTATRSITVNTLPSVGTTVTNATICQGQSSSITGTGAVSYSWQPGSLSGTTINVSPGSTTTYTVTGTGANGCTNTATRTITVNTLPAVGTTVTNATICQGQSTSITGTGAVSYSWQPGSLSGTTINVSPGSTTTYTVTGTGANGCTNTATRTITVNTLPTVGTTVTNATICQGQSTSITGTGAVSYSWQPGSLSGTTINVSPASTTTYTVTGTSANGCTNTATRMITVNTLPTVGTTVTNATICQGQSTSITGTGAVSYNWQPGSLSGTTINVSPASTTTYTVTGTGANGCTKTATRTITVNNGPSITTTSSPASICPGQSSTLGATGAVSYSWQPGSLIGASVVVSPSATTTYTVTGTGANGCTSTATRIVNVGPCGTTLSVKLFIQGYYQGGSLMRPVMLNQGVPGATSGQTDTISIELRNPTAPYAVASGGGAQKRVLNTNGTSTGTFNVIAGNYYIVVRHRNGLETWSANPVSISSGTISYDFSNAISKAFGNNQINVSPGVFALYCGDLFQDENVDALDMSVLETDILNFGSGYMSSDLDGDGNVDILDYPVMENNVSNFIFVIKP